VRADFKQQIWRVSVIYVFENKRLLTFSFLRQSLMPVSQICHS
jgi:hypothetical protein